MAMWGVLLHDAAACCSVLLHIAAKRSKLHHPEGHMSSYLSIEETCARIKRSRWTVYRLRKDGILTGKKRSGAHNAEVLIDAKSVDAYLDGRPIAPATAGR
jgi:hypothetical protein